MILTLAIGWKLVLDIITICNTLRINIKTRVITQNTPTQTHATIEMSLIAC